MIRLYPIKKLFAFTIALFAVVIASAQNGDYATLSKKPVLEQYVAAKTNESETVIKITHRTASKIWLTWTPFKGAVSHYVLERSTNGHNFYEAGILFTGEQETEPEYAFTDNLRVNYNGPLYYRLRVFGLDESEYTTPVTILNRGGGASLMTH